MNVQHLGLDQSFLTLIISWAPNMGLELIEPNEPPSYTKAYVRHCHNTKFVNDPWRTVQLMQPELSKFGFLGLIICLNFCFSFFFLYFFLFLWVLYGSQIMTDWETFPLGYRATFSQDSTKNFLFIAHQRFRAILYLANLYVAECKVCTEMTQKVMFVTFDLTELLTCSFSDFLTFQLLEPVLKICDGRF